MKTLKIIHNAGFFSCHSKRLEGIVWFFNTYRFLPDRVDSSAQFSLYKSHPQDDLTSLYFKDSDGTTIPYDHHISFYNELQFSDYKTLDLVGLKSFIQKYFSPSEQVQSAMSLYEKKYHIEYSHTCGIFYRGNDKSTETSIASYDSFISQARVIQAQHPGINFLVQTDETEFLDAFKKEFPEAISIEEVPHMHKKNSAIHDELNTTERAEFGAHFFAALLMQARCQYLITHSGNCGLWAVLYRGNCTNVYQWLNNSWQRSSAERFFVRLKIGCIKSIKRILKRNTDWIVT